MNAPSAISTYDATRQTRYAKQKAWEQVRRSQRYYASQLRRLAANIDHIVRTIGADTPQAIDQINETLIRYANALTPWAQATARRMLYETARRDATAWNRYAKLVGEEVQREITSVSVGGVYNDLMAQQVALITSLPRQAAQRVHEIATGHLYEGLRADELSRQIMETGNVTKSRADLIALTETSRAAVTFQRVRAEAIGSEGYIWRTARDARVRQLHRKLEGTFHRWDDPPVTGENGERSLPGAIYRCRCIAEPVFPRRD